MNLARYKHGYNSRLLKKNIINLNVLICTLHR